MVSHAKEHVKQPGTQMLEIPVWILTAIWGLIAVLLATIGYLIRFVINTNQKKNDEQDAQIQALQKASAAVDKKFVEAELLATKEFVDKEMWTRDYVTLTNRLDAVFKKIDRMEKGD